MMPWAEKVLDSVNPFYFSFLVSLPHGLFLILCILFYLLIRLKDSSDAGAVEVLA